LTQTLGEAWLVVVNTKLVQVFRWVEHMVRGDDVEARSQRATRLMQTQRNPLPQLCNLLSSLKLMQAATLILSRLCSSALLCRLWFSRPLPADAIEYAADDVRYLLPAAHTLLQQLPAALMCIGSLQQLLVQQGPEALRLQQQLLQGYSKLLDPVDTSSNSGALSSSSSSPDAITQRGLTQMQFELRTEFTAANTGWFTSSFVVYLNDDHNPAAAAAAAAGGGSNAAAAAAVGSKLVDVDGSKAVLIPGNGSSTAGAQRNRAAAAAAALQRNTQPNAANGSSSSSSDSGAVEMYDEAVLHIAQLLPDRCGCHETVQHPSSFQAICVSCVAVSNVVARTAVLHDSWVCCLELLLVCVLCRS
jgi:hypothetical protein